MEETLDDFISRKLEVINSLLPDPLQEAIENARTEERARCAAIFHAYIAGPQPGIETHHPDGRVTIRESPRLTADQAYRWILTGRQE
jgi:hypothetical protein